MFIRHYAHEGADGAAYTGKENARRGLGLGAALQRTYVWKHRFLFLTQVHHQLALEQPEVRLQLGDLRLGSAMPLAENCGTMMHFREDVTRELMMALNDVLDKR